VRQRGAAARVAVVRATAQLAEVFAEGADGCRVRNPNYLLFDAAGRPETVASDPTAHLLCHPANLAFRGSTAMV
jgi:hypothetical protein